MSPSICLILLSGQHPAEPGFEPVGHHEREVEQRGGEDCRDKRDAQGGADGNAHGFVPFSAGDGSANAGSVAASRRVIPDE